MSHPYSGAASYIYANEYRTPSQYLTDIPGDSVYDEPPSKRAYNYYAPEHRLEIDLQIRNAHHVGAPRGPDPTHPSNPILPDTTRHGFVQRRRAKLGQTPGVTSTTAATTVAFSPATSQTSSLPSHTSSHPHSYSHSHSRSHSGSDQPHQSRHNPSASDPFGNYKSRDYKPPTLFIQTAPTKHTLDDLAIDPLPTLQQNQNQNQRSGPKPKSTPLKLKQPSKFKLTLPNPFRLASGARSPWPPRGYRRKPSSESPTAGMSIWRWSNTIPPSPLAWGPSPKSPKSAGSMLRRWLSAASSRRRRSKSRSSTAPNSNAGSPTRARQYQVTPQAEGAKREKNLRFANVEPDCIGVGTNGRPDGDLDYSMVSG
ncbi:hypothetical protein P691DRAFT_781610 [Macrolepiota fuliginosa MF-IS2]|uniref:Uncharacterized protein n=1 Tax=Macrolepiota fuliginosa MF-IS2 TaxID=1400762 RepID=A0A9P5XDT9_9AGAR|nr:hypothetical protein P691DRAFT_781610 [Macrolepiota fuliginosa MF-IS2]